MSMPDDSVHKELALVKKQLKRLQFNYDTLSSLFHQTEQVRDANLKEKELQYMYNRLLLENCPDLILVLDTELKTVLHSTNTHRLLCLPPDMPLHGAGLLELGAGQSSPEAAEALSQICRDTMEQQRTFSEEKHLRYANGTERDVRIQVAPAIDADGQCQGVLLVQTDITDLTRERQKALEATHAKNTFLANMGHELRTPLNAVIGMAYLTLATELTGQQHDYVSKMYRASRDLLSLVNNILDFTRIESGRVEIEQSDFLLDDLLPPLFKVFNEGAEGKDLDLLIRIAPDLPHCLTGDSGRLTQAIEHLVENAVKFTKAGDVLVEFNGVRGEGNALSLQVDVRDTGIGMNDEQVERLFNVFSQVDGSTSRRYSGTGIGLALAQRLVAFMGGEIQVESTPGKGSRFTITCPVTVQQTETPDSLKAPEALAGSRILLVDPSPRSRPLLRELVESWGYETLSAASGKEGLERITALSHDAKSIRAVLASSRVPDADRLTTESDAPPCILLRYSGTEKSFAQAESPDYYAELSAPPMPLQLLNLLTKAILGADAAKTGHACLPERKENGIGSVLLVETNSANRQMAVDMLNMAAVSVSMAEDGPDALRLLHESRTDPAFDLVLAALQMPGMDGYELARRIRKNHSYDAVPIVGMTVHATEEERTRTLTAGMNGYIAKPLEMGSFYQLLSQWLPGAFSVAPQHDEQPLLLEIDGFDQKAGMLAFDGQPEEYPGFLRSFIQFYHDGLPVSAAPSEDLRQAARALATDAAKLGHHMLVGAANEVERLCAQSPPQRDALKNAVDHLSLLLGAVVESIGEALSPLPRTEPGFAPIEDGLLPAPDTDIAPRLARLKAEIEDFDAEALNTFRPLAATLAEYDPNITAALENCLEKYEFEDALELLARLMALIV